MSIEKKKHHEQQDLCLSRPCYRQGRNLTAVKVYTVSDESTHLLVSNVPSIRLSTELCTLCNRFGDLVYCTMVPNYENQGAFVETYHIQYSRIQSARFAKKQLDGRAFFGEVLHVCYAPELETVEETRLKLIQRRKEVAIRVRKKDQASNAANPTFTGNHMSTMKFSKLSDNSLEFPKEVENQLQNQTVVSQTMAAKDFTKSHQQTSSKSQDCSKNCDNFSTNVRDLEVDKKKSLKFVPRPLAVRKQIVFHKNNDD